MAAQAMTINQIECFVEAAKCLNFTKAEAMAFSAEMHFRASSMRKESRGWFMREDYPDMDNENWLKWIVVENDNGEMKFSTEDDPIDDYQVKPPPFH